MAQISLEKHFKALSKDSIVYGFGNMVLKVLGVITTPIITRIFSPADYGVINLLASILAFLNLIMIFGMDTALALSFYEHKKEKKVIVSSGFWFLFAWSIFLVAVCSIFSGQIAAFFLRDRIFTGILMIGFATAVFTLLTNYAKIILRLEFKAKLYTTSSVVNAVLATGFIILFTAGFHWGLKGYFYGSLLGTFLGFILALYLVRQDIGLKISKNRLWQMVAYGSMLVPASISTYIFDLSDRFFVSHYRNLTELGLYSMAFNVTTLISFFSVSLRQAWFPFIMKMYFDNRSIYQRFLSRAFSYYLIFFSALALFVTFFGNEFLHILTTEKFFGATLAIPSLSIAAIFAASIQVTSIGISISRKTKYIAIYTVITALVNTGLNFILIPRYGMVGAGWATAISYLLLTSLYFSASQKMIPFPVAWTKIIRLALITGLAMFLSPLLWHYGSLGNIAVKVGELAAYLIFLYFSGVIEKKEINYLRGKISNKITRKKDKHEKRSDD